jgi:hypothetical protein
LSSRRGENYVPTHFKPILSVNVYHGSSGKTKICLMSVKSVLIIASIFISTHLFAQKPSKDILGIDTSYTDYDALFNELDIFLDSITSPHTFILFNAGISHGYFNTAGTELEIETVKKLMVTPSLSYFHKSGWGLTGEASIVDDGNKINAYQYSLTGSYDFLKVKKFIAGLSYSRFFTKSGLPFYTSPLKNQLSGYFTYRRLWVKPSLAVSYGWGNRSDYMDREEKILAIQLAQRGFTRISRKEQITDFNITTSLRHDFYWLSVFNHDDYIRLTPQVSFSAGTHQFGFNQTSNTYATIRRTGTRVLYNTENISLDNNLYFQPLSVSAFLKTEYTIGKFFIQPQVMFDYYIPAQQNNFTVSGLINTGVIF